MYANKPMLILLELSTVLSTVLENPCEISFKKNIIMILL
jgi:hypothetical protein